MEACQGIVQEEAPGSLDGRGSPGPQQIGGSLGD